MPTAFMVGNLVTLVTFCKFGLLRDGLNGVSSEVVDNVITRIMVITKCFVFRKFLCNFNPSLIGVPTGIVRNVTKLVVNAVLMGMFRGDGVAFWIPADE